MMINWNTSALTWEVSWCCWRCSSYTASCHQGLKFICREHLLVGWGSFQLSEFRGLEGQSCQCGSLNITLSTPPQRLKIHVTASMLHYFGIEVEGRVNISPFMYVKLSVKLVLFCMEDCVMVSVRFGECVAPPWVCVLGAGDFDLIDLMKAIFIILKGEQLLLGISWRLVLVSQVLLHWQIIHLACLHDPNSPSFLDCFLTLTVRKTELIASPISEMSQWWWKWNARRAQYTLGLGRKWRDAHISVVA